MSQFGEIKGILFDKDGTLLDFNRTWLGPYEAAAGYISAQSGGRLSKAEVLAEGGYLAESATWLPDSLLASGSNGQIFESWGAMLGRSLIEEEQRELNDCFRLRHQQYVAVADDLFAELNRLRQAGYLLGIATMDDERQANSMVDALKLDGIFDFICGADSGYGVKPEPGMVLAFAKATGLSVDSVAMVGDSPRDINMGINAGAGLSIGVLTGAHSCSELSRYTNHVLEDVTGIYSYLSA